MIKRKTLRKIVFFLIIFPIGFIVFAWVYNNFLMEIDTAEIDKYYDLLTTHGKPSKYLVLDLGIKESDDIQTATDRLKNAMGLGDYEIWIAHHDTKEPPACIENTGYGIMTISIYDGIKQKRELINLLTHELGHIYVWNLDKSVIEGCDEEKVVDTSGMFLGLGILVLNGLTDNFFFMPGEEYRTEKKFYGYLRPEQFGYLLARYCAEHGIEGKNIMPFLTPAARKYFNMGWNYLMRQDSPVKKPAKRAEAVYWCPGCGHRMRFPITEKIKDLRCPECARLLSGKSQIMQ